MITYWYDRAIACRIKQVDDDVSDPSTIGERIRAVRLRTGLGQEAFAKALGYSKRALVSWELGGAEPPISLMEIGRAHV